MFDKNKYYHIHTNTIVFWLILFISCFIRLFALGDIPAGIHQDEALIGYNAFTLLMTGADSWGIHAPVYLMGWGSGTSILYVLLTKLCFYLYGVNVWALRLIQAVMGCVSCYVFYKLLRLFYSQQIALLGFFLISVMPWSIMNSRWALDSNIEPVFWLLAFYFYCCADKHKSWLLLSSVFYALTMYAYAGYWLFILLTLPVQYLYLLWLKKDRETFKTILFSGLLFAFLILPLGWLISVNGGWLDEYKSAWLSVPKLLAWRSHEIGTENLLFKLTMLYKVFILQNDGWLSNVIPAYGLFYLFTPLFMLIGIWMLGKGAQADFKAGCFSLNFCILLQIIVGFIYAGLIYAFSNRVNFLFIPLLVATTLGIWTLKNKRYLFYVVIIAYVGSFACFMHTYFVKYNQMLSQQAPFSFSYGLKDALAEAEKLHQIRHGDIYILEHPYVYSKVLFYNNINPQGYLNTVQWHKYPDPFIQARRFLYYRFVQYLDFDNLAKEHIYIIHKDNLPYVQNMVVEIYGNYLVAYQK